MGQVSGYNAFLEEIENTITTAQAAGLFAKQCSGLSDALTTLRATTEAVYAKVTEVSPDLLFANSVSYLEMFGHITISWLWLRQAVIAQQKIDTGAHPDDEKFYRGKIQAMQFFFNCELPKIAHWAQLVADVDSSCFDMQPEWF